MTTSIKSGNQEESHQAGGASEFDHAALDRHPSPNPHGVIADGVSESPLERLAKGNGYFASGQIASLASSTDATVTDVTIDGMDKLLEMARRVANRNDRVRPGSMFEAIVAWKENVDSARSTSLQRTFITHLEGQHRLAGDLERRVVGDVISHAQAKFTVATGPTAIGNLIPQLVDAKYDGMDLIIPAGEIDRVKAALMEKAAAANDVLEKARFESAAARLKDHDTTAREVLYADKYTHAYAAGNEAIAVGKELLVSASTAAVSGAIVGGAISVVKNSIAVSRGDISVTEASVIVAKDTGKSAGRSALTGAVGTGIRYGGQKAGIAMLGKTNIATAVAASVIDIGATILSYSKGEISGEQATERIGQNGTSTLSSIYVGAAAGALFGPVGAIVGSIAGYMVASSLYGACLATLRAGRLAEEEAKRIETLCAEAVQVMQSERAAFDRQLSEILAKRDDAFEHCFALIDASLDGDDSGEAIHGVAGLLHVFGEQLLFASFEEFDDFMEDPNSKLAF